MEMCGIEIETFYLLCLNFFQSSACVESYTFTIYLFYRSNDLFFSITVNINIYLG